MKKKRIHVTLPGPIEAALEALAELEDRTISDILVQAAREDLIKRGYIPPVTGEAIAKKIGEKQTSQNLSKKKKGTS